ncbi:MULTISPECIES: sensor histidine kinase [Roseomonadaceae]|uniref:histidine kinase n=1 Tax=Falsiroseomonas oleicola TaxID=2801474 RepID=A0ABS6HA31_9PROT|nr:HAMP domain-containing sensor histidine kinase [Roseomonas oleicola]MBU8545570.1 HAMP domain-containing histidine kinase [Roseomonas oleicola]
MKRCADRPPSLARRMTIGLISFHSVGILLLLLSQPLVFASPGSLREWFATEQATRLLAESLRRDARGVLVFAPTLAMEAYMQATPEFWFGASDGTARVLGGRGLPPVGLWPGEGGTLGARAELPVGVAIDIWTEGRRVGALIGGQRGSLSAGIWAWVTEWLGYWLKAVAVISVCTSLVTWWLVGFLLRPIRAAAAAASRLVPGQHQVLLPVAGVPGEILPLVTAANAAFDRLEKEHERQRRFIANAAHELRTPIAILSLRLDELPEGATRQRLRLDLRRLALLADQLLDLERMQHAQAEVGAVAVQPVEMVGLAREVVAEIVPLALDSGSDIAFHSAVPRWVIQGDPPSLRSVLLNLLGNALAHGGPGVQVELRIGVDGVLEVADHGKGVPAEARERVFEAFQRAGGGTGAGLGLYIVREVLRAHGASIELRDGNPGAVFRLRFPPVQGQVEGAMG